MSRSRKRKPYTYVCMFDHKTQTWAKNQSNRALRRIKRDLLQEIKTAEDILDVQYPTTIGSLNIEGSDIWGFPSDGGHYWAGDWKNGDTFLRKCYWDIMRK